MTAEGSGREYPAHPRVGVGIILFRGDRVLLIRRGTPPRVGEWSLPGGGQELGETVEETARRELAEETGLAPAGPFTLVDVVDSITRDEAGRVRFHYTLVDFAARAAPGEAIAGGDCAAVAWTPLSDIGSLSLWERTRFVIAKATGLLRCGGA
jgi:ADP-ribose pyrophosphatase YjhB (NUDIX family)